MSKYNQLFQEAKKEAENRIYGKCDHRDIIEYKDIQTVKHIGEILDSLEAKIEAANQWLPFDPANIPTPNKEYMLLLKEGGYGYFFSEYTSNINNGKLYWHACYGDDHLDEKRVNECYGATYKLIKL